MPNLDSSGLRYVARESTEIGTHPRQRIAFGSARSERVAARQKKELRAAPLINLLTKFLTIGYQAS